MRIEAFRRGNRLFQIKEDQSTRSDDAPSVAESEVSSVDYNLDSDDQYPERRTPLQWVFKGLTLWLELEEHDQDLTKAIDNAPKLYGTQRIPVPHATAVYGMTHLSEVEAMERLAAVAKAFPNGWPANLDCPVSVKCDLAVEGRPGQVCSIAWAELTLKTNEDHEAAIDTIYEIFGAERKPGQPWTPHISLAYDNPEDTVLNLADTISYVAQNPSLMQTRRVKAVSLWSTEGKMAEWKCLDRVSFF
ncbi:expressed unknown protein [Seminavis robusta]|uniref:2'-5' RNA ligase family protein n=1 Tax=Seminavis robusta TaxID=568900 RepID=A0A9N8DZF7_9STRA|nr:expressed unknown protein [Seminavis robusta]|eukprot:Sro500_g155210.1 n/a (246) ;mRNA; f:14712-15449